MRFRWINKLRADFGGYFWAPCPICSQYFGGHEWKTVGFQLGHGHGTATCPDCANITAAWNEHNYKAHPGMSDYKGVTPLNWWSVETESSLPPGPMYCVFDQKTGMTACNTWTHDGAFKLAEAHNDLIWEWQERQKFTGHIDSFVDK